MPLLSPFSLLDDDLYRRWRDAKLGNHPASIDEIVVEVDDPRALSSSEYQALLASLRSCNMALYASRCSDDPDKSIARRLGERFGLLHLNSNWLADDDGVSSLAVTDKGQQATYIPYTDRPIKWHTDGYYNSPSEQIRGLILHCVHPASEGGVNGLLDHELAYIALRDRDPELIGLLMGSEVMVIPPGTDMNGKARGEVSGPVFSIDSSGELHMRYTARKRNIEWRGGSALVEAVKILEGNLAEGIAGMLSGRLESGMGLICNNVLHDRSGFREQPGEPGRLLYRARYYDRVADCSWSHTLESP